MASRILLISTNRCTSPDPVFPLGLACVNAALLRAGHETVWVDFQADSQETLLQILKDYRPDFIGISLRNIDNVLSHAHEAYFGELLPLCQLLRERTDAPLILGGSGFSLYPEKLLELSGADFGIRGEGEVSLVALIAALEDGRDYASIPGLVFRRAGKVLVNSQTLQCLDQEDDFPARPSRLIAHYLQTSGMLNLQTQRGCSYGCCFCAYPLLEGTQYRRRSPEAVASEFEQLQRAGANYVFVVDSVFNTSTEHVAGICEAILRRNLTIKWGCFLRPKGLTVELMKLMHRAGLGHAEFGSDSFCDEVLHAYGKAFTFEDVFLSSELARQAEVDYCHFLIAGGPRETVQTLQASFQNSLRLKNTTIMTAAGMRIYPGTSLCARAQAEGLIDSQAALLAPVYYLAPGLTPELVLAHLQAFAQKSPAWISCSPPPVFTKLVARLRQRGMLGPLWSYSSMVQRLWPQTISSSYV